MKSSRSAKIVSPLTFLQTQKLQSKLTPFPFPNFLCFRSLHRCSLSFTVVNWQLSPWISSEGEVLKKVHGSGADFIVLRGATSSYWQRRNRKLQIQLQKIRKLSMFRMAEDHTRWHRHRTGWEAVRVPARIGGGAMAEQQRWVAATSCERRVAIEWCRSWS